MIEYEEWLEQSAYALYARLREALLDCKRYAESHDDKWVPHRVDDALQDTSDPVEAMRLKTIEECEAKALCQESHNTGFNSQFNGGWMAAARCIRQSIAALKAKP